MPLVAVTSSKVPLPPIVKQPAGVAAVGLGRAVGLLFAVHAAEDVVLGRPLDVVADEQVEKAIAVEVEPQRRRAEGRSSGQAARAGSTSTNVPLPVLRNSRFCPTQVISRSGKPSLLKSPTATPMPYSSTSRPALRVTSENVPLRLLRNRPSVDRCRLMAGPVHAVDQQDVLPAIAVVVQKGAARAQRLGQELLAESAVVMLEQQTRARGHVDQPESTAAPARRWCSAAPPWPPPPPAVAIRNSRRFIAAMTRPCCSA